MPIYSGSIQAKFYEFDLYNALNCIDWLEHLILEIYILSVIFSGYPFSQQALHRTI